MLIKRIKHQLSSRVEDTIDTEKTNMLLGVPFWEDIEQVEETYTSSTDYLHVKYKDGSKKSFIYDSGNWRLI